MDVVVLVISAVVFIAGIVLFIKSAANSKTAGSAEFSLLSAENNELKIQLARAQEKALWITSEKENITRLFKEESAKAPYRTGTGTQ